MQLSDTNIISELMRPSPDSGVAAWAASQHALCISVITVDELVFGLRRRGSARLLSWFDHFIEQVKVLEITSPVARRAGEMRAMLQGNGQVRTQADMMIAATASNSPKMTRSCSSLFLLQTWDISCSYYLIVAYSRCIFC